MQKNENFAKQAEQAEAERPEVVAWQYRVTAGPQTGWSLWHPGKGEEFERSYTVERRPLMTVAQHDRIVGELRAERDGAIKLLGQSVWQKIERLTQERDAALARVAELETALTPFAAVADVYDDSGDDDHEPYTDIGCDDRLCLTLGQHRAARTALSGAPSQALHSVPEAFDLLRQALKLMPLGTKKRAEWVGRTSDLLCIAQAQHSVPEISGIGRDAEHPRAVVLYLRNEPRDEDMRAIQSFLRAMAAPAQHSVPKAWLDVQAERRRQVEAEGWTPEHDDEHNGGELADAAACYALWAGGINPGNWREFWPWAPEWLKHSEPRRMLVKAAALILAEIQRLDRAAAAGKEVGHE